MLPTLALLDEETEPAIAPLQPSAAVVPDTDTVGPSQETMESSGSSTESPLTAWDVQLALLAVLVTISLVRDVPGLVELLLNRRTRVDSGARVAASTLVRYVLMFGGLMLVSSLLGLSWSSVQWLAAALTVGLGSVFKRSSPILFPGSFCW